MQAERKTTELQSTAWLWNLAIHKAEDQAQDHGQRHKLVRARAEAITDPACVAVQFSHVKKGESPMKSCAPQLHLMDIALANVNQHFDQPARAELVPIAAVDTTRIVKKQRLLTLPAQVQDAFAAQRITENHVYHLLRLQNSKHQIRLCGRVIAEQLLEPTLAKMVDEVLQLETFDPRLQSGFSRFDLKFDRLDLYFRQLNVDKLYWYFTPVQFRQLMGDQFPDEDSLASLGIMYTQRYDHMKGTVWQSKLDRAQLITELNTILSEAINILGGYNREEAYGAGQLLALLKIVSREQPTG